MEKVKPRTRSHRPAKNWELRLYVAGQTPRSLAAFANLKKICEEHLAGEYHIEVVDLLKEPKLASGDQNSCHPNPGQEITRTDPENHRRPLRY